MSLPTSPCCRERSRIHYHKMYRCKEKAKYIYGHLNSQLWYNSIPYSCWTNFFLVYIILFICRKGAICGHFPNTDKVSPDKAHSILYKERLPFIARYSKINTGSRIHLVAKTSEYIANDYEFQEMTMTFGKCLPVWLSWNFRKRKETSANVSKFQEMRVKSP